MARYVYNGRMCHLYKNDRKLQKIIENYQIDRKLQNWQKITKKQKECREGHQNVKFYL